MRMRALILLLIVISGTYMMFQSKSFEQTSSFNSVLKEMDSPVQSVTFIKPTASEHDVQLQIIEQATQIDQLIVFLENYQLQTTEKQANVSSTHEQFTILLEDHDQNVITILLQDDFVVLNDEHYYKIVNGPLDVEWLATFFFHSST